MQEPPTGYDIIPPELMEQVKNAVAFFKITKRSGDAITVRITRNGWNDPNALNKSANTIELTEEAVYWCPRGIMGMEKAWVPENSFGEKRKTRRSTPHEDPDEAFVYTGPDVWKFGAMVFDKDMNQVGTVMHALNPLFGTDWDHNAIMSEFRRIFNQVDAQSSSSSNWPDEYSAMGVDYFACGYTALLVGAIQYHPEIKP